METRCNSWECSELLSCAEGWNSLSWGSAQFGNLSLGRTAGLVWKAKISSLLLQTKSKEIILTLNNFHL